MLSVRRCEDGDSDGDGYADQMHDIQLNAKRVIWKSTHILSAIIKRYSYSRTTMTLESNVEMMSYPFMLFSFATQLKPYNNERILDHAINAILPLATCHISYKKSWSLRQHNISLRWKVFHKRPKRWCEFAQQRIFASVLFLLHFFSILFVEYFYHYYERDVSGSAKKPFAILRKIWQAPRLQAIATPKILWKKRTPVMRRTRRTERGREGDRKKKQIFRERIITITIDSVFASLLVAGGTLSSPRQWNKHM